MLNTTTKKVALVLFLIVMFTLPLGKVPGVRFLSADDWLKLLGTACIFAIGALGLNILTGLAGQVSLGHAFFLAIGAYTAAWLGGAPGPLAGMGLPIWIWLPAAGLVAAIVGILIAPTAVRVRGLYLAIVTLGLVFIGEYVFRNWRWLTGGSQSGRPFPDLAIKLWKEEEALIDFSRDGAWFGVELSNEARAFVFLLVLLILFTLIAKNIQRTRVGRAFQAIRDRDVAAEIMGVNEAAYKAIAFGISSFFAGVAGGLLASFVGREIPERWDLLLSVEFIAIILIGGAGTVSGTLMGSAFVVLLPRFVQDFTKWLKGVVQGGEGILAKVGDLVVSTGTGDWGLINVEAGAAPGLGIFQLNQVLFGVLIIVFLIFEPLGLYGIWLRVRNYWKGWPFTY